MEIKQIGPLTGQVPDYLTASKINAMLKCPLSTLYDNASNRAYRPAESTVSSIMGNLVHHVYERMSTVNGCQTGFDELWNAYEAEHSPNLKGQFDNYGKYKHTARMLAAQSFDPSTRPQNDWKVAPEQMLTDPATRLKGKPDLLLLHDGRPWVIKDYKTGQVTDDTVPEEDEIALTFDDLKADYQRQLYLYAALVFSKYGSYPRYLTVVPAGSPEISSTLDETKLQNLLTEIGIVRQRLSTESDAVLANPSLKNCRFCVFKPGCPYYFKDAEAVVTDLEGTVETVHNHPYGNLSFLLDDGTNVFECQPGKQTLVNSDALKNSKIFISNVRRGNDTKKLFLTTRYTKLFIKDASE